MSDISLEHLTEEEIELFATLNETSPEELVDNVATIDVPKPENPEETPPVETEKQTQPAAPSNPEETPPEETPPVETEKQTQPAAPSNPEETPPEETPPVETEKQTQPYVNIPTYQVNLPEDFHAQLQSIQDEKIRLKEAFNSGELDVSEYIEQKDVIDERGNELKLLAHEAKIAREISAQTYEHEFNRKAQSFFNDIKSKDNIDYSSKDHFDKLESLDALFKALKDSDKSNKSDEQLMIEAHEMNKLRFGIASNPVNNANPNDKQPRKNPVDLAGQSIAHLPSGGSPSSDVEGNFAWLDKLNGVELEEAIERLTPMQRKKYYAQ